ncbi:phospholipase [Actinophytocola xanthii]|uniref:Phospholipase n=2 Tax=Actinophytocola xanthii TaxID=1912961 RepID=A0A1Q8C8W6_9PSEU|nr:phospholipase [Actinophytocola xanthii]
MFAGAATAQAALDPAQLRAETDKYLFSTSLSGFQTLRAQQPHADQLNWSSDGCTSAPDNPFGFDFVRACHRHDFGYRNYRQQGRFTEANRLTIDNRFKSDMYSICDGNWACNRFADVYYAAVRQFGNSALSTADILDRASVRTAAALAASR